MKAFSAGGMVFRIKGNNLHFQQTWSAAVLRLLPLGLSPIVFWFFFWGPGGGTAPNHEFMGVVVGIGFVVQVVYAAWVLRDRFVPFVVDTETDTLRRGQKAICALSDIAGAARLIRRGRSNSYWVSLVLKTKSGVPFKLILLLTAQNARTATEALASHLNVPCLPDKTEGLWE